MENEQEVAFKRDTFLVMVDATIGGITQRFSAKQEINSLFSFLWKFNSMEDDFLKAAAKTFSQKYDVDVSEELSNEIMHLKHVYTANFEESNPSPLLLLNNVILFKLDIVKRTLLDKLSSL